MDVTYFSPQVPPAWLVYKRTQDCANKVYCATSDSFVTEQNNTDVYYKFNSYGYREQEYAKDYFEYDRLILAIGHSCVFGVTVRDEQCWPRLLEKSLPNTRVLNFGIPGASMDTIARMTNCLVPYFKPLCNTLEVATLWAQPNRREIFQENYVSSWSPWKESPFPEFILTIDDVSNRYNHQKNEALVKAVCAQHNVPLYIISWDIYEKATADGKDPNAIQHKEMLMNLLEQIK